MDGEHVCEFSSKHSPVLLTCNVSSLKIEQLHWVAYLQFGSLAADIIINSPTACRLPLLDKISDRAWHLAVSLGGPKFRTIYKAWKQGSACGFMELWGNDDCLPLTWLVKSAYKFRYACTDVGFCFVSCRALRPPCSRPVKQPSYLSISLTTFSLNCHL